MKSKKALIIITMIIIFGIIAILPITTYAQLATTPLYLGITELRTLSTPNLGYAIGDPDANTSTSATAAKIWNIVKYSTETSNDPTEGNIYCVKAGVGFSDTHKRGTYNVFYDMKTEREQIKTQNAVLASLVEGTSIPVGEGTVDRYNCILAIADLFYVNGVSSEAEKTAILEAAGIRANEWDDILTEDEIVKNSNIKDIVKPGMPILVQVKRDSTNKKGARVSTHMNIPGRFCVYMPEANFITSSLIISYLNKTTRTI